MKRVLLYIGIAIAAIGCTKDADVTSEQGDALTITSQIATRVVNEQWQQNDAIGVYMTPLTGDKEENVRYTTKSGDGNFASTTPLYFPSSGPIDLFAYYPHMDNVDLGNYPITSSSQVDLLSVTKKNIVSTSSPVALTFEHQLSKVSLTIKNGEGLEESDLAELGVKINNIGTSATFNLNESEVNSDLSAAGELAMTTASDGLSSSAIVIPQTLSNAYLTFETKNYGTFESKLATTEFAVGMEYKYTITINRDKVIISAANITPWNSNTETGTADIVDIELKGDVYHIYSGKGLAAFRDLVNGAGSNSTNAAVLGFEASAFDTTLKPSLKGNLTKDIDLSTVCSQDSGTSWTPIGNAFNAAYKGTFDGNNKSISKLYINQPDNDYQGLFGYVKNAKIDNVSVSGEVIGRDYVGGIVGYNIGAVEITNCNNSATVSSNYLNSKIGGIAGCNNKWSTITNCYNNAAVSGEGDNAKIGGIVGYNDDVSTITNCYNSAAVSGDGTHAAKIGGIVGHNDGNSDVINCYNSASISVGSSDTAANVGGIVGCNKGSTIKNCYNRAAVSGGNSTTYIGGVVGYNEETNNTVTGCFCASDSTIGGNANTMKGGIGKDDKTNLPSNEGAESKTLANMKEGTFVTTLNNGAYTYNIGGSLFTPSIKACEWKAGSDSYPTLNFGVEPTTTATE